MITKQTTIETLEVKEDMLILRERVAILEDGAYTDDEGNETQGLHEISHHFEHRHILPGDDVSVEDERIRKVHGAVFNA